MSDGRRCSRCHTLYPPHLVERAFQARRGVDASSPHCRGQRLKGVCRPCEQTGRDTKKRANRWAVKSRDVIRRHALTLGSRWDNVQDPDDLIRIYGWDPDRLAHDAEFQYGNGCNYCGHRYQDMGHGLADITLDVVDREKPPYYRTNTKWCCQTCNRKKGKLDPTDFEADRQIYEIWSESQAKQYNPITDEPGTLFYTGS